MEYKTLDVQAVGSILIERDRDGYMTGLYLQTKHGDLYQGFRVNISASKWDVDERQLLARGLKELGTVLEHWHRSMSFVGDPRG